MGQSGKATPELAVLQWLVGEWSCQHRQIGFEPKEYDRLDDEGSVRTFWDLNGRKLVSEYTGYREGKAQVTRCFYGWVAAHSRAQLTCLTDHNIGAIVAEVTITEKGEPSFSGALEIDRIPHTMTRSFVRVSDDQYEAQTFFRPVKSKTGQSFDQTIRCQRKN